MLEEKNRIDCLSRRIKKFTEAIVAGKSIVEYDKNFKKYEKDME
ncbi:MAG: hypothetical protein QXW78_04230 [Candidatus Thermoplasmatota archaeon]